MRDSYTFKVDTGRLMTHKSRVSDELGSPIIPYTCTIQTPHALNYCESDVETDPYDGASPASAAPRGIGRTSLHRNPTTASADLCFEAKASLQLLNAYALLRAMRKRRDVPTALSQRAAPPGLVSSSSSVGQFLVGRGMVVSDSEISNYPLFGGWLSLSCVDMKRFWEFGVSVAT